MMRAYQTLDAFQVPRQFQGRFGVMGQLWWLVQPTLFAMSPTFMFGWRRWLLRLFGAEVGKKVFIRPSVRVTYPWNLKIGDHVWIGDDVVLYTLGNIDIGNHVVISQRVYLCSATHDYTKASFDVILKDVSIEDQAWIATDAFIAPGVRIGFGALVGARSNVFSDMPEGMICFGSPAQAIRRRLDGSYDVDFNGLGGY